MWLAIFWPMLTGSAIAGYRDSTYLYYPLFQWIDWQMQQGEFPLWMPYENSGFPLLADGTSSLLYPGKGIFWLRFLSFPARYGWYLALHVLLAAGGSFWMAKTLGANRWGATLAAIAYAFGGSVLFQVCNVIYLISAAWLPWALCCVWKMVITQATAASAIGAGVCCSIMILGGDPQMVYHVGLIAAATTIVCITKNFRRAPMETVRKAGRLFLMVVVTSVLSAVQLLPTMEWAQYSDRANSDIPVNIFDGDVGAQVSLPDRPPVSDIYQFSQEPWSVLGLLFPNIFGQDAPVNTRWSAALPGADRIWVPSSYFGCLVLLLAMSGISFYTRSPKKRKGQGGAARVWLTWIAVWFGVASFGWYGVSWLMTECGWEVRSSAPGTFNQPVGGLYWLMVTVLPKYCLFRYPAKLMVVCCLGLCVLAGLQLRPRGVTRLIGLCWISVIIGIHGVVVLFLPQTFALLRGCETATQFGPFQFEPCLKTIVFALLGTLGFCGGVISIYVLVSGKYLPRKSGYGWIFAALIGLTIFDVGINNRWLLHPIDASVMTAITPTQAALENLRVRQGRAGLGVSVLETDFTNPRFFKEVSSNRVAELATWRRALLFPKTHLLIPRLQVWGSFTSIWPTAFDQINRAEVNSSVDAIMDNVKGEAELVVSNRNLNNFQRQVQYTWQNQTLKVSFDSAGGGTAATELRIPILPMPGWQARFQPNVNSREVLVREISPAGPLNSVVSIPESLHGQSFEVHCVYRPASFFWGRLISCCGWLTVCLMMLLKWFYADSG